MASFLTMEDPNIMEENCVDEISDDGRGNVGEKVEKGRERNREHAKRTRIKKKALLDGMKGKLLELQNEASRLQQALEERNTANILIHLCSRSTDGASSEDPTSFDSIKTEPTEFDPTRKGNIIQQLRTKVRSEAAQKNQITALLRSRNDSVSSTADSCTFANYDTDYDSDNDGEDAYQSLHYNTMNWKDGTVVPQEGVQSKISEEDMENLRKERNRVHAKLTRDRKKLFTSRMTQMIIALERQNGIMKNRLKSLPTVEDSLLSDKICDTLLFNESKKYKKRQHSDIDQELDSQWSSMGHRNPPVPFTKTSDSIIEESRSNDNLSSTLDLTPALGPLHQLSQSKSHPTIFNSNLNPFIKPLNRYVSDIPNESSHHPNYFPTNQNDPSMFLGPLSRLVLRDSNNVQNPPLCNFHCSSATAPDFFGAL